MQICNQLVQHIDDPEHHASLLQVHMMGEDSLLCILWPMHVHAVAVQEIANVLEWCPMDEVIVLLCYEMVETVLLHLFHCFHFIGYSMSLSYSSHIIVFSPSYLI